MPPRRAAAAAFALLAGASACIPTPDHPSSNYDAGPLVPFDVPAEDRPRLDVPPVDRPVPTDRGVDAGTADVARDAPSVPTDGPDPNRRYPMGPYGSMVGEPFPAFTIASCAGGTYFFAGDDWRPATATVVEFTSGSCADCPALSAAMQSQVATPYRRRGVRVVGVFPMMGGPAGDPPTADFCAQWIAQNHIDHPMALDLGNDLGLQTFGMLPPQWVLVDANGRIVWRAMGTTASLAELVRQLNALVGAP